MRSVDIELPRHRESVRVARHALQALDLGDRTEDVRLIVSELVTNAVEHGGGDALHLHLRIVDGRVIGEVTDGGNGADLVAQMPEPGAPRGRGLAIVEALTDGWGAYEGSTHVWFELSL